MKKEEMDVQGQLTMAKLSIHSSQVEFMWEFREASLIFEMLDEVPSLKSGALTFKKEAYNISGIYQNVLLPRLSYRIIFS